MSMSEENQTEAPKKKVVKKKRKARAFPRARAEAKPEVPSEFAGISSTDCCAACNKDGCVISAMNYCAHPFKNGLQALQMNDSEALRRYNRAKGALRNQMIDLRGR
jgi:hypothetical protein